MSEVLPPLIETPKGLYKHYKGGMYRVLGNVRHSEDLQPMTLYQALYGDQGLWGTACGHVCRCGRVQRQGTAAL